MTISQYNFADDILQSFSDEVRSVLAVNPNHIIENEENFVGTLLINNELKQVFTRIYSFVFDGSPISLGFNSQSFNIYSIYGTGKLNNEVFVIPSNENNVTLQGENMTLLIPSGNNAQIFIKITYGD